MQGHDRAHQRRGLGYSFVRPAFDLAGGLIDAIRGFFLRKGDGRYFAFDGRKIRVVVVEGEPWVAESGILVVPGPKALRL